MFIKVSIFVFFLLFQFTSSSAQSKEYKFLQNYIDMKTKWWNDSNVIKDEGKIYFLIENEFFVGAKKVVKRNDRDKFPYVERFNDWLDSLGCKHRIKDVDMVCNWDPKRINYANVLMNFKGIKPYLSNFISVTYFTISKPVFYKDYVLFKEMGGRTCYHVTGRDCLYRWNQKTGELIEIKIDWNYFSGPCFR